MRTWLLAAVAAIGIGCAALLPQASAAPANGPAIDNAAAQTQDVQQVRHWRHWRYRHWRHRHWRWRHWGWRHRHWRYRHWW